ncbi:hypothetical protein, partial [Empedobacter sp.]|uniref:hypothetical protein n=1 Tax=Empedobacter sp. TaxID=1927715 RepID=UPI0028A0EC75
EPNPSLIFELTHFKRQSYFQIFLSIKNLSNIKIDILDRETYVQKIFINYLNKGSVMEPFTSLYEKNNSSNIT